MVRAQAHARGEVSELRRLLGLLDPFTRRALMRPASTCNAGAVRRAVGERSVASEASISARS